MADLHLSAAEARLEWQKIGALQIGVAAICTLVNMCDGYDVGSIGWAVPLLTHAWHVAPPAFAVAFLWSNIGILVGALVAGPMGDRFGRKPLLLVSVAIFGLASLGSAFAPSLGVMAFLRFFTGVGIAGGFAGTVALTGDYAPRRLRATLTLAAFTGAPVGGFVGGQVVAALLHAGFGWQSIFIIGGAFPLALLLVIALWLPESPRVLAARERLTPRQQALLQRFEIVAGSTAAPQAVAPPRGNPVLMLFRDGYAWQTVLLWIVFFFGLVDLYLFLFWLPEVLHLTGLTPAQGVFAASMQALGGIASAVYLGIAMDKFGCDRSLSLNFLAGSFFTAVLALVTLSYTALLAIVFCTGVTVIGSQTGANAACSALYPARMRATAIGWATGVGRLGGIAAGPLGGMLLAWGLPPRQMFLVASGLALIAATATALLALRKAAAALPTGEAA